MSGYDKTLQPQIFSHLRLAEFICVFFSSGCPYGLELSSVLRDKQKEALENLNTVIGDEELKTKLAIGHVLNDTPPSTDVGVERLLGTRGVFESLDPMCQALPEEFYNRWDGDFVAMSQSGLSGFGAIEEACALVWMKLEEGLESIAKHWVTDAHWAIRRWSSNFLLHLGAFG